MEGRRLTRSRISIHNAASDGSKAKMNVRLSFSDKISARVLTDSAPSTARTFFHSSLGEVDADLVCSKPGESSITSGSRQSTRSEEIAAVVDRDTLSTSKQCEAVMKRHISFVSRQIITTCTTSTSDFAHIKRSESLVVGGCCTGDALGVVAHRCVGGCSRLH